MPPIASVTMVDPGTGKAYDIAPDQIDAYAKLGFRVESPEERGARTGEEVREELYGGVGGAVKAGAVAGLRGVTLGLSDAAARVAGGEDAAIELEGLRRQNPTVSTLAEIGGVIVPALVTGGAALPAGAASALGRGTAAAVGGGFRGAIAGAAVEGGLFGLGTGVSELSLSRDPITIERAASVLSSNALYGAGLGAGAGLLGKAAEVGLSRAKGAIDSALERRAAKAKTPAEAIESGDLELLDVRQLKAAREAELEAIDKARAPERQKLVDDLWDYRDKTWEKDLYKTTHGVADGDIREAGGALKRADKDLRNALDNKAALARDPRRLQGILERQEQALETIHGWGTKELEGLRTRIGGLDDEVRADILAKKVHGEYGPFTPAGLELAIEREAQRRFETITEAARKFDIIETKYPGAIEAIQGFKGRIEELAQASTSARLTKIEDALSVLAQPKEPSLGNALLSAAAPFAGPLGTAAVAGNRVLGNFKKVLGAAAARAGKAASGFLGAAATATKYTPPLATKVLAAARFGEPDARERREKKIPKTLPELYAARTSEVKSQVHVAPDGSYQMRPEARQRLASRFDGIRAADPRGADQLEEAGARRIEYLASIMPRLPDYGVMQVGPERRRIPELEMRSWARSVAALEDPHAVFERAMHGRVTPEDAAAIRAVYPELLADFIDKVSAELPTLRKTLPYKRRLALSILTGVPVDPAMTPGVLRVIQGMYASEPGTAGGTQAPVPQPQFGSVKRSEPGTPSQRREERTAA